MLFGNYQKVSTSSRLTEFSHICVTILLIKIFVLETHPQKIFIMIITCLVWISGIFHLIWSTCIYFNLETINSITWLMSSGHCHCTCFHKLKRIKHAFPFPWNGIRHFSNVISTFNSRPLCFSLCAKLIAWIVYHFMTILECLMISTSLWGLLKSRVCRKWISL